MGLDDDLRTVAEVQHGVVSRRQAREVGATASAISHRLAGPDWDAPTNRVLRLVGAPRTLLQTVMIHVLHTGPGAVASHLSAAALWRVPGFGYGPVQITMLRGRAHGCSWAVLHRPRSLPQHHVTELQAIPVTTLPRTLFDLAGERSVSPGRLERALDTVLAKSPGLLPPLHSTLDELAAHGRAGIAVMRSLLAERPVGYMAPASNLEARFTRILASAGERPMERQLDVGGHEWIGRVDFVDRTVRLIVEVDGDRYHTSKLDRERDHHRDAALRAAGWQTILRVTEEQVWHRPTEVVDAVRRARRKAA